MVTLLYDFEVLRLLSSATYLQAFEENRLQALAMLSVGAHGAGYNLGLFFAGLGSTLFCCLWFKSGLIPKTLAAFGIFASIVLAARTGAVIVFPELRTIFTVAYYGGPIFLFEVAMGLWLVLVGVAPSSAAPHNTLK